MSGDFFDYAYLHVYNFAEELENSLKTSQGWSKEVEDRLKENLERIRLAGLAMKEIELLYSGDIGQETFLHRMKIL